jgi:hypothetical protein
VVRSREVLDAHDKAFIPRDDALDDRHSDAYVALMAARSTGPAEMAQHLRWMLDQLETSDMYDHQPIANVEALASGAGSVVMRIVAAFLAGVVLGALVAASTAVAADQASTADVCQAAWDRAGRIRVELGLRPGPRTMPKDPLRPREACELILAKPEAELRRAIRETNEICGGDCPDLLRAE